MDLAWAKVPFPILASNCVFNDPIDLTHSRLFFLSLSGSSTKVVAADSAAFENGVFLSNGFKAKGSVILKNATIRGDLDCTGGEFVGNDKTPALNADGANIDGAVFLRNDFKAKGAVIFRGAKIKGTLNCVAGDFVGNGQTPALNVNGAYIQNGILFRKSFETGKGFRVEGGVDLTAAKIGIRMECDGGDFVGEGKTPALNYA